MQIISFIKKNQLILFLLFVATVLRFINFFNLQYTYDELSALNRIEFNSFSDLIEKGVKIDAHPALIQVFLFYYCKFFGTTEWIVKLPFIISGIWSVYLIYNIGKRWFNETSGLLAATLICCTQYFVFYSVTARPYISGVFICLLVLKYWLEILFNENANKKHYFLFALFSSLAALNHHFSMMFAALCGIIGIFFISKANAKYYILSCIAAVIIYSPHFPILFYQLKVGGIGAASGGWLNPPENDFIIQFIFYLFHFSYLFAFAFLGIIFFTFFKNKQKQSNDQYKIKFILFTLFTLSFLIGFLYSIKVNPVIQFSTLIFASPCLILFLTSFAGELNLKLKWITVLLLLIIGASTLLFKREYYDLVFKQSFDTYIKTSDKIISEKGSSNVFSIFKGEQWFLNFYKKKYHSTARYKVIENDAASLFDYKAIYDTLSCNYLVLGDFNPTQLLQASVYYPFIYQKIKGYSYEIYVLSKIPSTTTFDIEKQNIVSTNFKNIPQNFNVNKDLILTEGVNKVYQIDGLNEYPISYKIKNTGLHIKEGQYVVAEIKFLADKPIKGLLCASTDALNKNIHWTASEIEGFYNSKTKIQTAYVSSYVNAQFNLKDNDITFFVWNNKKEQFQISSFSIYTWDNNPYRYGLLSDF